MELTDLLEEGAVLIQESSDEATNDLDTQTIVESLLDLLGDGQGGLNLIPFVTGLSGNGLAEIAGSWLGNGENMPISATQMTDLFGTEKISEFASHLGVSVESATEALTDALPQVIDRFTAGEGSILDQMLDKVGAGQGAMDMLSKMFR
ncbi:MAG: YidB family protein [Sulfurovum sp.]|nr:YidB family protein [Sulfurovum sp.]